MKTIDEIYQEMLARFAQETGHEASGSGELAVRLYAVAAQIHSLYLQAEWTARQCFPQTADGEYLDLHAQMRGLERRSAVAASGMLRFSIDEALQADLYIPLGTVCMTAGLVRFETTQEGILPGGALYVDVPGRAMEPGSAGNVSPGTILTMSVPPMGIARCSNPEAFSGGTDDEGDESLRGRILDSYKRLPNGANIAYYEQQALSFDQVAAAQVLARRRGIGTVDLVVATTQGIPDEQLLEQLADYFESRREIAVDVDVLAPTPLSVNVSAAVAAKDGYDADEVCGAVEDALQGWFTGERLGTPVLLAQLGQLIYSVDGVDNYRISAPAADVAVELDQLPRLGSLVVSTL